ncbi:hypothetical protein J3R82DRAFT_8270 [Butyriboletus roseoflavus]|nr:hypothetical protein J3R82DRAFT_8270 [Butyriboletus roseoflavus]
MDSRRAETLEAFSAYLQHQRTLLARTQADIERLKQLKAEALASPEQFANRRNVQENDVSTSQPLRIEEKISQLQDYHPAQSFPAKINWEAFSSSDATPLRTLAIRTRIDHTQRALPSNTQQSPLSFLQKFVKDARKVILDPVFEGLSASADAFSNPMVTSNPHVNSSSSNDHNHIPNLTLPSSPSENENEEHQQAPIVQESMTAIRKRERAHANIRELKRRKLRTDLVVGCKLGKEGFDGVFVRHDIEDESAEVDVNMETPRSCLSTPLGDPLDQISDPTDVESAGAVALADAARYTKLPETRQPIVPRRDNIDRPSRSRKPSLKLQSQYLTAVTENVPSPPSVLPMPPQNLGKRCHDVASINDAVRKPKTEPLSTSEVNADSNKNRSGTYKQAWSISEQHLLERLLEDIPDGERNRWAKISQAMGGRRTPRQVASRVQKYFEKLKRFGVGVDYDGKANS